MRKIDTICSQLASKSQPHIKSEPMSPSFASSSHAGFPPMSPSANLASPPFSSAAESSYSTGVLKNEATVCVCMCVSASVYVQVFVCVYVFVCVCVCKNLL